MTDTLEEVMERARTASLNDRIDFRDDIARFGIAALDAMEDWVTDPDVQRFAIRVIGRVGQMGEQQRATSALLAARDRLGPSLQGEVDLELVKLGYSPPKPAKPRKPTAPNSNPYDVGPLAADAGLSWPGFQERDFGGIAGTSWRRRNDPISMPPLITQELRKVHPHFSSWTISRSPAVHFAITDRYRQFDDPNSGWRAAKLVVYALGPTDEAPSTPREIVSGLYVEKGTGTDEKGAVDARWDWPRFVASLTEPSINALLAAAMERHSLRIGDLIGQAFQPPPERQIGGVGRVENGVLVFRSHDGAELFRGWEAMRHQLEQLPEGLWHDLHIWRTWPAADAIAAGPPFARDEIAPVLVDLGSLYLEVVRDAIASGLHALHRIVERRFRAGGMLEIVCLVQAHAEAGHFTLPRSVMDDLGIPTDGRVNLDIETLEGQRRYAGELSIRSGSEVYYRVGDPETAGLERILPKEWLRVIARAARS